MGESINATTGQKREIYEIGTHAFGEALVGTELSEVSAAKLLSHKKELADRIRKYTVKQLEYFSRPDRFSGEYSKVMSGYFSGYRRPDKLPSQAVAINQIFSNTWSYYERTKKSVVPSGAEGLFTIPRWNDVASNTLVAFTCDIFCILLSVY